MNMGLHLFHTYQGWEMVGQGMIVRAQKDIVRGQLLSQADVGRIIIGKFVKYISRCKKCTKHKTKYEDIIYEK